MNAAEYSAIGVALCRYRAAVDQVDASLQVAMAICADTDPGKAADIAASHMVLMDALTVVDGLLQGGNRRKAS
jgi:hypothetical protein